MRLFVLLLLVAASTSVVVLAQSPSSENEGAGSGGLEFLPFSVEGFELNSSVSSLRELDQAVGEAVVVFQRARTRLDITKKLVDLQGALVDESFKATEALHAALQRAKDKAQRQGNAEGLLALQEALSQLDKGQVPISGAYLDGSADREAVKYRTKLGRPFGAPFSRPRGDSSVKQRWTRSRRGRRESGGSDRGSRL